MDGHIKTVRLVYVPQRAVKGQALADFLADHPIPDDWELNDDLPGEGVFYIDIFPPWEMYFDGAARRDGVGAAVIFVPLEAHSPVFICAHSVMLKQCGGIPST